MTALLETIAGELDLLVDRRSLARLGFTVSTVDHVWKRANLVQVAGDSKWYARRDDVLELLTERARVVDIKTRPRRVA